MRALVCLVALVGCSSDSAAGNPTDASLDTPDTDSGAPFRGFRMTTPTQTLPPGTDATYCFYFRTPNTEPMAITKWSSLMSEGHHHLIMYLTANEVMPAGTMSATNCGFDNVANFSNAPVWTYAAQTELNEIALPTDDGTGRPVAQIVPPNSPGFFQIHFINAGETTLIASAMLTADALDADAHFTQTAAFVTYDQSITIPPMTNNVATQKTCTTPTGAKFWSMTTHTHKQAISTEVKNGMPASADIAFQSADWEHPGTQRWASAPFYSFASGGNKLTVTCTYNNASQRTIMAGDNTERDELCMASGYYFPANNDTFCVCSSAGCVNF